MRTGRIWATGPAIVLLAALAALVAGCGDPVTGSGSNERTAVVDAPEGGATGPAPAATTGDEPETLAGPGATTPPAVPEQGVCAAQNLTGTLEDIDGAVGHTYANIVLVNRGGTACQLSGYPTVEYVDAAGARLGAPAEEDPGKGGPDAPPVTVPPGGQAVAELRLTQPGTLPGCVAASELRPADALRVAPAGSAGTVLVDLPNGASACVSTGVTQLLVGAFTSHD
ncbi:MAG: DUF4232 domain-containing protein [Frankia sp.]|nr:DUF4232 domain-containing protein [Frankia sp.]